MVHRDSASILQAMRTDQDRAGVLTQDWRRVTLKGSAGGEAFILRFFDIEGRECAAPFDSSLSTLAGTTEFSLANALTLTDAVALNAIFDDGIPVADWAIANRAGVEAAASIRVDDVSGTIAVGYGAAWSGRRGEWNNGTWSIPYALQDQHLLADGQIFGFLPSGGTTQTVLRAAVNLAAGAGNAVTLHFAVSRPNANLHLQYTAAATGTLVSRVRVRTGTVGSDIYGEPVTITNTHDTTTAANNVTTHTGLTPGVYELRVEATSNAANSLAINLVQFD